MESLFGEIVREGWLGIILELNMLGRVVDCFLFDCDGELDILLWSL